MNRDERAVYSEGCKALRHYSNSVMRVRVITVVQGLVILGTALFLLREDSYSYSSICAGFGLVLSIVLFFFCRNYYNHFDAFLEVVNKIETESGLEYGPWRDYYRRRRNLNFLYKLVYHHSPFILLAVALIGVLVISIYGI